MCLCNCPLSPMITGAFCLFSPSHKKFIYPFCHCEITLFLQKITTFTFARDSVALDFRCYSSQTESSFFGASLRPQEAAPPTW